MAQQETASGGAASAPDDTGERLRIPVREESLSVSKREVDTGRGVRVTKVVDEHAELVDPALMHERVTVERVPMRRVLENGERPAPHYEGDTLVIPVCEEILVVEKRLAVVEEVRLIRHREEHHAPQTVKLRRERAFIERFDERSAPSGQSPPSGD